jgi:REP element-mobilizing transposase RayT
MACGRLSSLRPVYGSWNIPHVAGWKACPTPMAASAEVASWAMSGFFSTRTIHIRRRRLPHWTTELGTYFVTFRLKDALSDELARRIALRRRPHALADRFLDRSYGRCWLRDPRIAAIIDGAIRFFDGSKYLLHAWTIMPNHVHVAFRIAERVALREVTKSWKGYTAREVNKILGRHGALWQDESYDSLLHDEHDLTRVVRYIEFNPVKAGLVGWPWVTILDRKFSFGR